LAKSKTPSYVLILPIRINKQQEAILHKRIELGRKVYNTCLGLALKHYKVMTESKVYRQVKNEIKSTNNQFHNTRDLQTKKELGKIRKTLYNKLEGIYKEYNLTNYGIINSITPIYKPFNKNIDSRTAYAIGDRVWIAISNLLTGEANELQFKRYGEFNSLEGKWNKSGMKYNEKSNTIEWNGMSIPAIVNKNDTYAHIALNDKIKYCRIVRKQIRGKYKFYVQLILEGIPPKKYKSKTGEVKHHRGKGKVGIDIGTQTIALCSNQDVKLLELAPNVNNIEREKKVLQRKLDRQRRRNNPSNYNTDGTTKNGIRIDGKLKKLAWYKSNKYNKTQQKLKELYRKQKVVRKQDHEKLANYILTLGDDIKVEKMNYKGLQKRAKKTTVNEKTGKFNKKKRFGKSLANKAPSMLLEIINRKLSYDGLTLLKVNTYTVKASQYNHFTHEFTKKELSNRWNDDFNLQRDLYSAFLIMNVKENLSEIDREMCFKTYEKFKELHDKELNRLLELKKNGEKLIYSMGI